MEELLELRFKEEHAGEGFSPQEGVRLGGVRKVTLSSSDPRLAQVGELQRALAAQNDFAFAGWRYIRKYSTQELAAAQWFHFWITKIVQVAGEECGTVYDDSASCPICKAGRRQISPLRLDLRRGPKKGDFARTIANEWLVTERVGELIKNAALKGLDLRPVEHSPIRSGSVDLKATESGKALIQRAQAQGISPHSWEFQVWLNQPEQATDYRRAEVQSQLSMDYIERVENRGFARWYQLVVTAPRATVVSPTRFGIDPFDEDKQRQYVCPLGHTEGPN